MVNEELAAEIRAELEQLERHKQHLLDLLRQIDPLERERQEFIDGAYKG